MDRKSPSDFLTQRSVTSFIEYDSAIHNVHKEWVVLSESSLKVEIVSYKKIEGEWGPKGRSHFRCFFIALTFKIHHYKQIHVRIFRRTAVSERPEKNNLLRLKSLCDFGGIVANFCHRCHNQSNATILDKDSTLMLPPQLQFQEPGVLSRGLPRTRLWQILLP